MFITFEGIEGAGKSTAIAAVADGLKRQGRRVLLTQEPKSVAHFTFSLFVPLAACPIPTALPPLAMWMM